MNLVSLFSWQPSEEARTIILTAKIATDIRRGEYLTGFVVRAGFWIDGIQLLTSLGRKSAMFGKAHGGSA